jgi:hypothetical protein
MVVIAQKNPIRRGSRASRQIIDMGMPLDGIESQPRPSRLVSVAITIAMVFALLLIVLVLIAFFASAIATADHPLSGTSTSPPSCLSHLTDGSGASGHRSASFMKLRRHWRREDLTTSNIEMHAFQRESHLTTGF